MMPQLKHGGVELRLSATVRRRTIRPELKRVRELIPAQLCQALALCSAGKEPWPLFITGPAGCGKSRAALYLCDRAMYGGAVFYDFAELCEELRAAKMGELREQGTHSSYRTQPSDIWRKWAEALPAVLDEIGMRSTVTDHQYETLKLAIDKVEGRPAVFISNLSLNNLAKLFDSRIASRLASGTVCDLAGEPDQRLLK